MLRALEDGRLPPIALVHGADPQLLDDTLAAATRGAFPDPTLVGFGREVMDARETTAETIVRSALTMPLMTPTRLVVVRHAQELPDKARSTIEAYAQDPNPSTCLLLLADELLEARRESGRDVKAHWLLAALSSAVIVTLTARKDRGLADWLKQRAAHEGLRVSEEAAKLLVEWVGEDTATLLGEARKAALAGGAANREVGRKEVTAIVGEHRVADVFDLTRAIERGDRTAALQVLDRLLRTEEPMRLLSMLSGSVRLLWTVHEARRRGQGVDQIARAVRRPPFVVEALSSSATGTTREVLAYRLRRCFEVEHRLKSGGESRAEMTALVAELCDGR